MGKYTHTPLPTENTAVKNYERMYYISFIIPEHVHRTTSKEARETHNKDKNLLKLAVKISEYLQVTFLKPQKLPS